MRMSESMTRVLLPMTSDLRLVELRKRVDVERRGLVRKQLGAEPACGRRFVTGRRLDRTPRRGPDRKHELLHPAVPVADLPRDRALFRFPEHPDLVAQRCEVRVSP